MWWRGVDVKYRKIALPGEVLLLCRRVSSNVGTKKAWDDKTYVGAKLNIFFGTHHLARVDKRRLGSALPSIFFRSKRGS